MPACFKAFCYYSIYTCIFTFLSKFGAGHYMYYCNAMFFQLGGPCFRIACRSKYYRYFLFQYYGNMFINIRV